MKNTVIFLLSFLLLISACERNPLYYRLASDYYPVTTIGNQWEYTLNSGGTMTMTVIDQAVEGGRTCYRVQYGADYSYWIDESTHLEHYEDHRVMFNGYEVPLYQAWVTWLNWPLAVGNIISDSVSTTAEIQGVTISHDWQRITEVLEIGTCPESNYTDCYLIHQSETTINWIRTGGFEPETTTVERDIWLAPNIGMVRKTTADSILVLSNFQQGN